MKPQDIINLIDAKIAKASRPSSETEKAEKETTANFLKQYKAKKGAKG